MKNKKQKSHSCNYNKFLEEYKKLSKEELIKKEQCEMTRHSAIFFFSMFFSIIFAFNILTLTINIHLQSFCWLSVNILNIAHS